MFLGGICVSQFLAKMYTSIWQQSNKQSRSREKEVLIVSAETLFLKLIPIDGPISLMLMGWNNHVLSSTVHLYILWHPYPSI